MIPFGLGKSRYFVHVSLLALTLALTACEENAATGQKRFTGLMPASQEASIGATEHEKILQSYGGVYPDKRLQAYVTEVGKRVSAHGERTDTNYTFTLLDSSVINAFAIPGGYIYVTRGLLAAANSEAELAAVLAHETGHITGRHSAQRYSTSVATSLGTSLLGAVLDSPTLSKAVSQGAGLWLKSYSRDQENEADNLGMRYLVAGGYDPQAMPSFLYTLQQIDELESAESGNRPPPEFMSTHPVTANRVANTQTQALNAPKNDKILNRDRHLDMINGITYGDSANQGFVRNGTFLHPQLGFAYNIPAGFSTDNQADQVVSKGSDGSLLVFDMVPNKSGVSPASFLGQTWLNGRNVGQIETINGNGLQGATVGFNDSLNGQSVRVQLVAWAFDNDTIARFQVIIPNNAGQGSVSALQTSTYSLRHLREDEKGGLSPERIRIVTAKAGDTPDSLSRQFPKESYRAERFRAINGLGPDAKVQAGTRYKIIATY